MLNQWLWQQLGRQAGAASPAKRHEHERKLNPAAKAQHGTNPYIAAHFTYNSMVAGPCC